MATNDGGSTNSNSIVLGLMVEKNKDKSVKLEWYDIGEAEEICSERIRMKGIKEDLSKYPLVIKSPAGATYGSSVAVVGKYLYLVGGGTCTLDDSYRFNSESHSHLFCLDTTAEIGWVRKKSMIRPRNMPILIGLEDKLYCFGHQLFNGYPKNFEFGQDEAWAEIYDRELDIWSEFKVQATARCRNLPWHLDWNAIIPREKNKIYFCGHYFKDRDTMLYCLDLNKRKCDIYDEDFVPHLVDLVDNLANNHSEPIMSDDWRVALGNKPAQDGNLLYFTGRFSIFCYDLLKKLWLPAPMEGFDRRSKVLPSPLSRSRTRLLDYPWRPNCKIMNLGNEEFCTCWVSWNNKFLYWTKFMVEDGSRTQRASCFSATKKIRVSPSLWYGNMKCFPIKRILPPTNDPPLSEEKKIEKQVSHDILLTLNTPRLSGASEGRKRKRVKKRTSGLGRDDH